MSDSIKEIGGRIKALREKQGLTMEQLGKLADTTHVTIGRIERGLQPTNLVTFMAIADALGVPPWELLRPEGAQPRVERVEHELAECYRRVAEDAGKRAQAPAPEPRAAEPEGDPLAGLSAESRARVEKLIEIERIANGLTQKQPKKAE